MSTLPAQPDCRVGPIDWGAELVRHARWLKTVLFARVGDAATVDDLWQNVSLAAVKQHGVKQDAMAQEGADNVQTVGPWLYRLALRQVMQHRRAVGRRQRREREYVLSRMNGTAMEGTIEPPHWMMARERSELVRAAVAGLGEQDAEILLLKYTEGWNYRQLADHLGLSEAAVESRLHRARERLRGALTRMHQGPNDE